MTFFWTLYYGYIAISLVAMFFLWRNFSRQPLSFRWLAIAVSTSILFDLVSLLVLKLRLPVVNVVASSYAAVGVPLFGVFFYHAIGSPRLKKWFVSVNIVYVTFALVNFTLIQTNHINSYTHTIQSILIASYSILYYFQLLKDLPTQEVQTLPLFWVVSGLFLAYSGYIAIFGMTEYMISHRNDPNIVPSIMHHVLTVIQNVLIAIGVWLQLRRRPV